MANIDIVKEEETLRTYWQDRNDQMVIDRNMINLVRPVKREGEVKWVSNEPKVFYETSVALISSYPARFRLPLTINFTPEEKDKMNKAERFVLGIFRSLDNRQYARGQAYWLRELAYWICSGWYAVFNMVDVQDGETKFIADLWDPMTVYPEWDSDGLVKCIRSFEVDKVTALSMISGWQAKGLKTEVSIPGSDKAKIRIINYWVKENKKIGNALYVAGKEIKPLTTQTQFKDIPIQIGAIGVPEVGSEGWKTRRGENIIASNRDMNEYENVLISLMVTIMAETAYPNIVSKTRSGAPAVKAEDVRGFGQNIPLRLEESLELLKHASTPDEALQALNWVKTKQQKGSLPDVVYGGLAIELSGFAISQLMAAIKYKLSPYLNTMQHVISQIASNFLYQYGRGNFGKVTLSTTNPSELKKGLFFVEEFSKQDVPKSLYVEVTIPITSSLDKTQQMLYARQALSPPQLISRETLWDEVLDIQDSEQEYARIIQDQMLELPVVKQIAMIEQLRQRVAFYRNEGMTAEAEALNRYVMMLEMELGMRQGIPVKPDQSGVSPALSPPEMGASPDQLGAALGRGPSGVTRRPQTPEERTQTKATGGSIVSPTGERLI